MPEQLALIVPPFIVSPGLLQKIFGARDDRAVRVGVGLNAFGLFAFAIVPAVLGIVARSQFPSLDTPDAALPMILVHTLPPAVGALGLAAVFSAEISAADAVLFMLTTSLSQDLYKRFVAPGAPDDRVLRVARLTAVASGVAGTVLAIALGSVVNALTIFYTLVGVSLFIPIIAGLYVRKTSAAGALATMGAGVCAALALHVATGGRGWGAVSPAIAQYEVETRQNIEYAEHNGTKLTADLYLPKGLAKAPVVISVHGGGWQNGNRAAFKNLGPYLAKNGFALFNISYRLGKAGIYPAEVYDVKAAIQFVRAKAGDLGVDPDRIGLMGASFRARLIFACTTTGSSRSGPPPAGRK